MNTKEVRDLIQEDGRELIERETASWLVQVCVIMIVIIVGTVLAGNAYHSTRLQLRDLEERVRQLEEKK